MIHIARCSKFVLTTKELNTQIMEDITATVVTTLLQIISTHLKTPINTTCQELLSNLVCTHHDNPSYSPAIACTSSCKLRPLDEVLRGYINNIWRVKPRNASVTLKQTKTILCWWHIKDTHTTEKPRWLKGISGGGRKATLHLTSTKPFSYFCL
jgi:hypothetical protein